MAEIKYNITLSKEDALKKAHQFIIEYATKEGLYDI